MNIRALLKLMADKKASDLFMTPNAPVKIKIEGRLVPVNKTLMDADVIKRTVLGLMTEEQAKTFREELEVDFAIAEDGIGRFRVNAFHQRGTVAMVMRFITSNVPKLTDLGMPDIMRTLVMHNRGLVLMVGATGSGKSTSLAAMIDYRNENTGGHILTIEDPIEFLHSNKNCIVNQREIGVDTKGYHAALRSAVREAPNVILIGEIRDRITMEAAITLAGTGHLAISTLHANNAAETLDRIINMFPQDAHGHILMDLSQYLRGIISQRLVQGKGGKRVAAVEVMINAPHISELIRKGDVAGVKEAVEDANEEGMQDFDTALFNLYRQGRIELEEALRAADSRANLETKINFGM